MSVAEASIYQHALGADFERLHPELQWRLALAPGDGICQIGHGVMEQVERAWWAAPVLALGASRRVLCPSAGQRVPFSVSWYAYLDRHGRSTLACCRRLRFPRRHGLADSTTVFSHRLGCLVDYLGTHQNVASELVASVDEAGALCLTSRAQRLYLGRLAVTLPPQLCGTTDVREWWDEARQRFGIEVHVRHRLGQTLGYRGYFEVQEIPCRDTDIPLDARPLREEIRE